MFVCLYQRRHMSVKTGSKVKWNFTPNKEARSIPFKTCQLHMMVNVTGINSLQWLLLCPWASQQLSHIWIPKEPDELRDWPHKGFRKGNSSVILITVLLNSMSDCIKSPARGPEMLWIFKCRFAKSTYTEIFVNFNAMSSEPSVSSEELDEKA